MIEIASERLRAAINPLGAELSSLRDEAGRELMTDADPAYWSGRAPLLFPIVGKLNGDRYRYDGRDYAMPQHGFARRRTFELVTQAEDRAAFRLTDDAETRAAYPFAFALDVDFAIHGAALSIGVRATNRGEAEMPASFGFHPAFAWPLPYGAARGDHRIVFAEDEPEGLRYLSQGGIAPDRRPSPLDGKVLALDDGLFANDALIWDRLASRSVRYGAPGTPQLEIDFPEMPMLGIWTKPGAQFVCIEPWHGLADPAGFDGDLREKPGIALVAPGQSLYCTMRIALLAASCDA